MPFVDNRRQSSTIIRGLPSYPLQRMRPNPLFMLYTTRWKAVDYAQCVISHREFNPTWSEWPRALTAEFKMKDVHLRWHYDGF